MTATLTREEWNVAIERYRRGEISSVSLVEHEEERDRIIASQRAEIEGLKKERVALLSEHPDMKRAREAGATYSKVREALRDYDSAEASFGRVVEVIRAAAAVAFAERDRYRSKIAETERERDEYAEANTQLVCDGAELKQQLASCREALEGAVVLINHHVEHHHTIYKANGDGRALHFVVQSRPILQSISTALSPKPPPVVSEVCGMCGGNGVDKTLAHGKLRCLWCEKGKATPPTVASEECGSCNGYGSVSIGGPLTTRSELCPSCSGTGKQSSTTERMGSLTGKAAVLKTAAETHEGSTPSPSANSTTPALPGERPGAAPPAREGASLPGGDQAKTKPAESSSAPGLSTKREVYVVEFPHAQTGEWLVAAHSLNKARAYFSEDAARAADAQCNDGPGRVVKYTPASRPPDPIFAEHRLTKEERRAAMARLSPPPAAEDIAPPSACHTNAPGERCGELGSVSYTPSAGVEKCDDAGWCEREKGHEGWCKLPATSPASDLLGKYRDAVGPYAPASEGTANVTIDGEQVVTASEGEVLSEEEINTKRVDIDHADGKAVLPYDDLRKLLLSHEAMRGRMKWDRRAVVLGLEREADLRRQLQERTREMEQAQGEAETLRRGVEETIDMHESFEDDAIRHHLQKLIDKTDAVGSLAICEALQAALRERDEARADMEAARRERNLQRDLARSEAATGKQAEADLAEAVDLVDRLHLSMGDSSAEDLYHEALRFLARLKGGGGGAK